MAEGLKMDLFVTPSPVGTDQLSQSEKSHTAMTLLESIAYFSLLVLGGQSDIGQRSLGSRAIPLGPVCIGLEGIQWLLLLVLAFSLWWSGFPSVSLSLGCTISSQPRGKKLCSLECS